MSHAVVAIDERGGHAALERFEVGTRIDMLFVEGVDVLRQAEHAVRICAGEIGFDDAGSGNRRIGGRHAAGRQYFGGEPGELRYGNIHCLRIKDGAPS